MRESSIGFSISVAIHLLIGLLLVSLPMKSYPPLKAVLLDFTLIKGESGENREHATGGNGQTQRRGINTENAERKVQREQYHKKPEPKELKKEDNKTSVEAKPAQVFSDPHGQTYVRGEDSFPAGHLAPGATTSSEGRISGYNGSSGGTAGVSSSGRILNYGEGGGGHGEFTFIRENIIKNVRYPEKARRMGWEGKVVLSFTVFENGSIQNVKVIKSSGFPVLDDSAKDALVQTTFSKRIPVRLVVILPVEYRLQ